MLPVIIFLGVVINVPADQGSNPLAKELIDKGVEIPRHGLVKLPPPSMDPRLPAAKQKATLGKVADKYSFTAFTRNKDVAPHLLKITAIDGSGKKRRGQALDLWFVAHGSLKKATDNQALERFLGTLKEAEGSFLSEADLKKRGIALQKQANLDERYTKLYLPLLDKVRISGVSRAVKTTGPGFLVSAMQLDPRFARDAEFPNQWRAIKKKGETGPPHPYAGFAGYLQITELKEPAGALLVEFHVVLSEPPEWFEGRNLLKAKLPLAIQERVRSFRRVIKK